ncbi:MAG: ATP synthase F1 subunit delta [Bacteroidia bacterium]|nr:ATP synthase F1 subunit delta [Bacteroidia bacterium]
MSPERIAQRYARSLFDLAQEKNAVEAVKNDFDLLENVYNRTPEFRFFLRGPEVQPRVKARVLKKIFARKLGLVTERFLELLTMRGRVELLPFVVKAYGELYHRSRNEIVVRLVVAQNLSEEHKQAIAEKIHSNLNQTPILQEEVRPELVGGFKLLIGTRLYDQSVSHALRKIENEFLKA